MSMALPFYAALLFLYLSQIFVPTMHFMPFAPFLVIALARSDVQKALWLSLGCGFGIDVLSPGSPMGMTTISYVATALFLSRYRNNIFVEKAVGISSFTAIFSSLATLLQLPFMRMPFSFMGLVSDLIATPILDGIYAFCWFHCPVMVYTFLIKIPVVEKWKRKYIIWRQEL